MVRAFDPQASRVLPSRRPRDGCCDFDTQAEPVLNILVASDCHLGINERDPIRKNDARNTFEEIFQIANEREADMVLLAGNLFHDNKPSRKATQGAIEVLRNHCLGDREVEMEIISDQGATFHGNYRAVNYEDPNYNVQLPVFAIHGDHDDPGGEGGLSALDVLSSANLLNYFGRVANTEKIFLHPILMRKGGTKVALYGLGHLRDDQLTKALEGKQLTVGFPEDDADEWFNVLAVHQNRAKTAAGAAGAVKEVLLPKKMDVVVWGHERECTLKSNRDAPESDKVDFQVLQPGATVATELSESEAGPKCVAMLQIRGENWKQEVIELTTVRPFIVRELVLEEHGEERNLNNEDELCNLLTETVEEMLEELRQKNPTTPLTEDAENRLKYPLVRLKVDYTGYSTTNPQKFGARFVDRVANPSSMIKFTSKQKRDGKKEGSKRKEGRSTADADDEGGEGDTNGQIKDLVGDFLAGGAKDQLRMLPQSIMDTAVFERFVIKEEKDAISKQIETWLMNTQKYLTAQAQKAQLDAGATRKEQEGTIEKLLADRTEQTDEEAARNARSSGAGSSGAAASGTTAGRRGGAPAAVSSRGSGFRGAEDFDEDFGEDLGGAPAAPPRAGGFGAMDEDEDEEVADMPPAKGKAKATASKAPAARSGARGGGHGSRGGRAARGGGRQTTLPAGGGKAKKSGGSTFDLDSDDDAGANLTLDDDDGHSPKKRAAPSAAASRSKRTKAAARTYRDDDEDDDDDDDDDEVQEVEAPPPSSRGGSSLASRRRQR